MLNIYSTQRANLQQQGVEANAPQSGALRGGESGDDLLSRAESLLSLALGRFTVLFGMGRGGTAPLWSPDITGCFPDRFRKAELGLRFSSVLFSDGLLNLGKPKRKKKFVLKPGMIALECIQGYRVKPYGQLVLVSLMHYCTSTPSLSTS